MNDGFIAIDKQWQCTYMNRAAEEFNRLHRRNGNGKTNSDPFPLTMGDVVRAKLEQAAAEGVTVEFESYYEPWQRWFEIKGSPADGSGLAIHFRDITERKLAQIALAESEERLRLAQQGAKAGLWDWDLASGQLTWFEQYYEIHGLPSATVPSHERFLSSVHPDDRAEVDQAVSAALQTRAPLDIQYRIVHPTRGLRWIAVLGRTIVDPGGRPLRMSGISLDITDRKKAEENLRFFSETGTVLTALVDLEITMQKIARLAVPFFADWCVVDIVSSRGKIERVAFAHREAAQEPVLKELLDRSPSGWHPAALEARVLRFGRPEFASHVPDDFIETLGCDSEVRRLLERLHPVSYAIVPLLVREQAIGTLSFVSSDAGRRYSSADLELATELARRAAVAIDNARLYRELTDAQRQKDDFLAMLAHELRNPLAAILYANEILKATDETDNPAAEVIDRQLGNLTHLIDDLLDVSRITQDKIQLKKESIDGATVAQRAIATAEPLIKSRGHELAVDISSSPMPLVVDPVRAEQVLVNLLTNAAKYTREGGTITVRAYPEGDHVVFKVKDTGIGIPPEMLPRVFELFTQVEQSLDRSQGGLGIGLTVVRKLVGMHDGRVSVKSEGVGCGSEFTVGLPLSREAVLDVSIAPEAASGGGSQKILVVDDNVDTAKSILELLRRKGFAAAVAHDGHAALEMARSFGPDVVLLDLGLPGIDGYRVAKILRSEARFAKVRFIALSGYGQPEDRNRSREAGFNHHLVKPVAFKALLSILSAG